MTGILAGYDGSQHSARALQWAVDEAAVRRAPLTVLSVRQARPVRWPRDPDDDPADRIPEETTLSAEEEAGSALAQVPAGLPRPLITVKAVPGAPAEELLRASAGADMVVVGARGAGGFAKLLLGSVSSHLTHHAHCPVVVVPDDDR